MPQVHEQTGASVMLGSDLPKMLRILLPHETLLLPSVVVS